MTVKEYADAKGMNRQTVLRQVMEGKLAGAKTADGWIVYGTLDEFPPAGTIATDRDNSEETVRRHGMARYSGEVFLLDTGQLVPVVRRDKPRAPATA